MSQGCFRLVLCLFTLLLFTSSALAESPEKSSWQASNSVDDAEVAERLEFINQSFENGELYAGIWWWGWMGIQFGSTVLFSTLAYTQKDQEGALENNAITAAQSAVGVIILAISPLDAAFVPRRLRPIDESTPRTRRAKLYVVEQALEKSSKQEKFGRHWINHVLGFALAAAGGLLLTFAFDETDWRDGLVNFGLTLAVTELMIWTQPMRSVRDLETYQKWSSTSGYSENSAKRSKPVWVVAPTLGGFYMALRF